MFKSYLQRRRDSRALRRSGLFADAWYRQRYLAHRPALDPIRHYVQHGAALGHDPHPRFDARWYLSHNTDVRAAGTNPFAHYVTSGRPEGRAPNPWGEAGWHPHDGPGTAPALIDLMREHLDQPATGAVDMLTPDFVAGWVSCAAQSPHLVVEVGDERFTVRAFEARPDLADYIGRPAFAFVLQFPRRQAPGTQVAVRFADGEALLGSPDRVGDTRPQAAGMTAVVNIDTPSDSATRRIVEIAGWIKLPDSHATIDIAVDGERRIVDFRSRADIIAFQDSPSCVGFALRHDAAANAARGRETMDIEVFLDGCRVAHHVVALALEPVPVARPPLALFMHIPKTAGVSLTAAIDSLPDPRALWLYDDEHSSIADKLTRLSPHAFDDLRIVGGHFTHGIESAIARSTRYVTVLREPSSFLKSFFFYCKYVRRHDCLQDIDIYEALEARVDPYLDNAFTRHFARVPGDRAVVAGDLVVALRVMERDFDFVGFVEHMDESVARISQLLGTAIPVRAENKTPPTAEAEALDPQEFAARSYPHVRFDEMLVARARGKWWSADPVPVAVPNAAAKPLAFIGERRAARAVEA